MILREDDDGLCTLWLNRPDQLNALSPNLFIELRRHIDNVQIVIEDEPSDELLDELGLPLGVLLIRGAPIDFDFDAVPGAEFLRGILCTGAGSEEKHVALRLGNHAEGIALLRVGQTWRKDGEQRKQTERGEAGEFHGAAA